ncbi:hypothetical protein SAMN05444483_101267 [Salegentibacter echinorum]|uniref:Uncharacterized protein n=1 Tax=Salegentibacter echinorum TaxID=1073325 RepID=A0A1M5BZX6_SALEC|nr:hypothetical protein [Salegentibacter echinorum]SHF47970.1 hypothetical protein SAMN05444483_101267 [Salegentibacter echinorum]
MLKASKNIGNKKNPDVALLIGVRDSLTITKQKAPENIGTGKDPDVAPRFGISDSHTIAKRKALQ